jgi:hypothetical protein
MRCGVFFIDAIWSGTSRTSFARLTEALARLDLQGHLELLVVGIDESFEFGPQGQPSGLAEIHNAHQIIGGNGETVWVNGGKIIAASNVGQNVDVNTKSLLGLWRPLPATDHWPSTVIQLLESLLAGEDCGFALHDALLEAGHTELAQHFREEQWHPKGCWALDLILGKK